MGRTGIERQLSDLDAFGKSDKGLAGFVSGDILPLYQTAFYRPAGGHKIDKILFDKVQYVALQQSMTAPLPDKRKPRVGGAIKSGKILNGRWVGISNQTGCPRRERKPATSFGGLEPEKADATTILTCFYTLKKHVDILKEDFLLGCGQGFNLSHPSHYF